MLKFSLLMCALASTVVLAEHDLPDLSQTKTRPLAEAVKKVEEEHSERSCVKSAKYPNHLKFNEDGTALLLSADTGFETFSIEQGTPPKLNRSSELRRNNLGLGSRDIYGLDDFSPDGKKIALITMEIDNSVYGRSEVKGYFLGVYSNDGKKVLFERRIGKPPYPTILQFTADGKSVRYGQEVFDVESGNRIEPPKNQKIKSAAANQIPITRVDKTKPRKLDFFETESAADPKFSVEVQRKLDSSFTYRAAISPDRSQAAVAYYGPQGFELCLFNLSAR